MTVSAGTGNSRDPQEEGHHATTAEYRSLHISICWLVGAFVLDTPLAKHQHLVQRIRDTHITLFYFSVLILKLILTISSL